MLNAKFAPTVQISISVTARTDVHLAARDLKATEVVLGVSEKVHAEDQLEQFALAWGSAMAEMAPGEVAPPPDDRPHPGAAGGDEVRDGVSEGNRRSPGGAEPFLQPARSATFFLPAECADLYKE
jgi:hypothetical protein